MGQKYVLELEEEPFENYGHDGSYKPTRLWRVKGFDSLVFDESGISKLTTLYDETEEIYQRGYDDAVKDISSNEQAIATKVMNEVYEAAKKICLGKEDGGISDEELLEIFHVEGFRSVFKNFTATEVVEKLIAYESMIEDTQQYMCDDYDMNGDPLRDFLGNPW